MIRACRRCGNLDADTHGICPDCASEVTHEVGECELCGEPILRTEDVGAFASGLCHQDCAERALDAAEAARDSANDAYEHDRG